MQELSDAQLLRDYAERGHEAAFREIVKRHTDVVYSSALRQVGSSDLAQDVAQSIFGDLARKAKPLAAELAGNASLLGWLYRSTRFAALRLLRDERRRHTRERQVMEHFTPASEASPDWDRVSPVLDEAMADLNDEDREALLLRFFKNHDFRAIGAVLGVSDDTAQKRVSRALERLRAHVTRRGVATTAVALTSVLSGNAVTLAPIGLAATLSSAALAGTTITSVTATTAKAIAMTTLQKTLVAATLVAAIGTGIYEARQASQLRDHVQTLQQQQAPLAEQIQQLEKERDDAARQLVSLRDESSQSNRAATELLRLRAEVARLRADSRDLAKLKETSAVKGATNTNDFIAAEAKSLVSKAHVLKQLFEKMPEKKIPELQFLGAQAWLNAAQLADVETEAGITEVMSKLRKEAKNFFTAVGIQPALASYTRSNAGQLPSDISQLKPYFEMLKPGDDVLQRYQVMKTGNINALHPGDIVIAERHPVDEHYDTLFQVGVGTWSWHGIGANTKDSGKAGSWRGPPANQ